MAQSEAGIQADDKDNVPESREERIKNYLEEKNKYVWGKTARKLARRLDRRANQRFAEKLTPEQKQEVKRGGRMQYVEVTKVASDDFSPTSKLKDNTVIGPLDGKGSWKTDYDQSVIDTTAGKFCPGSVADKNQIHKEKIAKGQRHEDKVLREKYTNGVRIDPEQIIFMCFDRICMQKPREFEKKIKHTEKTFEEKLCDTINSLDIDKKSMSDRAASFTALQAALSRRLVPDIVKNNYATIADALERTLRKGRGAEQMAAAKLVPVLCVQLGEDLCEVLLKVVKPPFLDIMTDTTVDASIRAECCQALAIISFLSGSTKGDIPKLMKTYETIFSGSYQQDDDGFNKCPKAERVLDAVALDAWSLLLSKCSPAEVRALLGKTTHSSLSLSRLAQLLKAPSLELRMSACVVLSLVFELGLEFSERFGQDELAAIIVDIEQLANESSKFRAKKHRQIQRDVLKFLEEGVPPVERVSVGDGSLELDTWNLHVRYRRLAAALGSGLQVSTETDLLRSALLMGHSRSRDTEHKNRKEKPHRKTAEAKERNISRAKKRDERSAIAHY